MSHLDNHTSEYESRKALCASVPTLSDDHLCPAQNEKHRLHQRVVLNHEVSMVNVPKAAFQKLHIHLDDTTSIEVDELCPRLCEEDAVINVPLDLSRGIFQNLPVHLEGASYEADSDELQPPKSEELTEHCKLSPICHVKASKLDVHAWKTSLQVALMISRMKIYESVIRTLGPVYSDNIIEKAITMSCSLRSYESVKNVSFHGSRLLNFFS